MKALPREDGVPFVPTAEEMAAIARGEIPPEPVATGPVEFDISPEDAVRLATIAGRLATMREAIAHQQTLFGVVCDRIRRSANLPEGADFKTDDTGLKGRYEPQTSSPASTGGHETAGAGR